MRKFYKLFFTVILLLGTTTFVLGQTTQEEYNYITKGYEVQIESGLDMKKGYSLTDLGTWGLSFGSEKRYCEFKGLYRDGETKPCAIMMIYKRTDIPTGVKYYICIPSAGSSEEILKQALNLVKTKFSDNNAMLQTTIWALMSFAANEASK